MHKQHRNSGGFQVETIRTETKAPIGRMKLPGSIGPEKLNMRDLKWRMCSLGPKHCETCESSCAYGREYVKRMAKKHETDL